MQREVPFSVDGLAFVPDDFYRDAKQAIQLFPDEWDMAVVGPEFERNADGFPTAFIGAGCYFRTGDRYAAFIVEAPRLLLDDALRWRYIDKIRHAFQKAGVA